MNRWILLLDPVVVLVFVAIGRDTHDEGTTLAGISTTAAPFLIAVAMGWLIARAWRDPISMRTAGVLVGVTLVAGMVLRRIAFGEGTAAAFVVVAGVFLTLGMVGWRLTARRFGVRTG